MAGSVSELTVTGLGGYAADWFTFGTLTFTTGANAVTRNPMYVEWMVDHPHLGGNQMAAA